MRIIKELCYEVTFGMLQGHLRMGVVYEGTQPHSVPPAALGRREGLEVEFSDPWPVN